MKAWIWRAIEARPGGMPTAIAGKRKANWPTNSVSATATSWPNGIAGRGRKTTGSATSAKRTAARNSGGTSPSATVTTTKLKPQNRASTVASRMWRGCTGSGRREGRGLSHGARREASAPATQAAVRTGAASVEQVLGLADRLQQFVGLARTVETPPVGESLEDLPRGLDVVVEAPHRRAGAALAGAGRCGSTSARSRTGRRSSASACGRPLRG